MGLKGDIEALAGVRRALKKKGEIKVQTEQGKQTFKTKGEIKNQTEQGK